MNVILTGATGFLGSALARAWAATGHRVTAIVRPGSSLERLRPVLDLIQILEADTDMATMRSLGDREVDAVVHTACAYGRHGETLLQIHDANVRFGMLLLQSAIGTSDRRITFLNTGTVLEPSVSHYARSKHQFSAWGRQLASERPDRLQFVNVALQHMYGPGDSDSKFTSHVIRSCLRNVPELALTAGEQHRDFVYIDDVVTGYSTLLDRAADLATSDEIELGSGMAPPLRDFVERAHRLARSSTRLHFGAVPYRPNEAMHCQADISRLRALGWQPSFDLDAGIARTIHLESES